MGLGSAVSVAARLLYRIGVRFPKPLLLASLCACAPAPAPVSTSSASAASLAAVAPSVPQSREEPDDAAIARTEDEYLALLVAISPETATALGEHSRDAELDAYSRAEDEAGLRREETMLDDLRHRFAHAHASRAKLIDLALHESACQARTPIP
jgi:hypothetical protein